ncbi:hypothetical protein [Actinomadura sp. 7K507]|uniref:hypothetical protein n=1 Tax=Actinomadura sp. 7K507 TaxID=2530365 RepID=UPI001044A4E0|nr:hypothetical protein [Actinomadura sp. 7K507]TDC72853.1 hypothetical protein E1285_45000 [Actinomadura sp. 7K507]
MAGLGRLLSGGPVVPADGLVAVGAVDRAWSRGECAYVISVGATGPARVHYSMSEPAGPTWLRLAQISERRRRRVLDAALRCGVLAGAGLLRGGPAEVGRFGWLHVAGHGLSGWTILPPDRRIGGVAFLDLVGGLVPGAVWRDLHARRQEAWQDWARRSGSVPSLNLECTRRDPDDGPVSGGFDAEATRRQAVDQGPWDAPVAGRRRPGDGRDGGPGEGWPGIRHGGGMGGAW